ncbi:MAG: KamA family radical SAM protein, partial [bacterium]
MKPGKDRFTRLREASPDIFKILQNADSLEKAREQVFYYCYMLDRELREGVRGLHPLEWSNAIECLQVFKNMLSRRNERLAGESSLKYLWMIAQKDPEITRQNISHGFFEEFIRLFKGMHGNSNLYSQKDTPSFVKYQGRKAANLRSEELDRISQYAESFIKRYKSGLDENIIRIQEENQKRILGYFKANKDDWKDWKWQIRNVIRDSKTLSE